MPGNFALKSCGNFGEFFFWSPFPTKRSTTTLQKIRGKFRANSGQNSERKFEKFGELSSCNFSDCDSPDPRQGPEPTFLEKRVSAFRVQNPHFHRPSHGLEKGVFGQKSPFPLCSLADKRGFSDRKLPFPGRGEMGFFWNNHKGGTVTRGYGFGYASDLYPSPF